MGHIWELPVFDKLFGYFLGNENILYIFLKTKKRDNLKKNRGIYHIEGERVTI